MTAPRQPIEHLDHPPRIVVAICGDPVVGRALVLLLQGSYYEARYLPPSSVDAPGSLDGVRLLLLTPTWELDAERREALLASLRSAALAAQAPILELTSAYGEPQVGLEHTVPWPCTTEELERRIHAALHTAPAVSDHCRL